MKREAKKRNKNLNIVIILIVVIAILSIYSVVNLMDSLSTLEKRVIYSRITASNVTGFDVNGTALIFGYVKVGSTALKKIDINNTYNEDIQVNVLSKGDIKRFLEVSENDFILEPGQNTTIGFEAYVPKDTPYGDYEGEVIIRISRVI